MNPARDPEQCWLLDLHSDTQCHPFIRSSNRDQGPGRRPQGVPGTIRTFW